MEPGEGDGAAEEAGVLLELDMDLLLELDVDLLLEDDVGFTEILGIEMVVFTGLNVLLLPEKELEGRATLVFEANVIDDEKGSLGSLEPSSSSKDRGARVQAGPSELSVLLSVVLSVVVEAYPITSQPV